MKKVDSRTMERRVNRLDSYAKKHGWVKVAAYLGYENTSACRMWVSRKTIPELVWEKLVKLLDGEVNVEISVK